MSTYAGRPLQIAASSFQNLGTGQTFTVPADQYAELTLFGPTVRPSVNNTQNQVDVDGQVLFIESKGGSGTQDLSVNLLYPRAIHYAAGAEQMIGSFAPSRLILGAGSTITFTSNVGGSLLPISYVLIKNAAAV